MVERVIEEIGAKNALSVHTEHPEWFENRWTDKVLMAEEGKTLQIAT